jgi:hypothetical protein
VTRRIVYAAAAVSGGSRDRVIRVMGSKAWLVVEPSTPCPSQLRSGE